MSAKWSDGVPLADPIEPLMAFDGKPGDDRTTVLLVDDNADVRAYLHSILDRTYRIIEARDGDEGLTVVREALPDLVVADVMMPGLDGLALGRVLKTDPMTDAIPLILLTARAEPQDQVAGLTHGADAYLVKPADRVGARGPEPSHGGSRSGWALRCFGGNVVDGLRSTSFRSSSSRARRSGSARFLSASEMAYSDVTNAAPSTAQGRVSPVLGR